MRVVHVLASVAVGGGESVALMLATAQVQAGHRVTVVSFEEPPAGGLGPRFERAGVEVLRFPKRAGLDVGLSVALLRYFRGQAFDVVHTHNPLPLIYAAMPARAAGAHVVHTKHGPHPDRPHRLWLRRLGSLAVGAFVAVSEDAAAFATSIREVSSGRLHVVHNGIDIERFKVQPDRRRQRRSDWGVDDGALLIGTVGRMAPVKNHALLLRAAAPMLGPSCRLVIVGDGPERPATEALIGKLGISQWVHLPGATDDVPSALSAIDVFALPSHVEGLPLAIMEAMACGLPVVATRVGGVPTVVDDGRTGLLVAAGDERAFRDALSRLRDAPELRSLLGASGLAFAARELTSSRMLDAYSRLYQAS